MTMGLFWTKPQNAEERKEYNAALAKAQADRALAAHQARVGKLKEQARIDAMPRSARAKERLGKGFTLLKNSGSKLRAFDAKMEARAKATGSTGGIIQQGYKAELARPKENGLIQQSLRRQARR